MRVLTLAIAIALAVVVDAQAQVQTTEFAYTGKAFKAVFTQADPAANQGQPDGYRVYVDGAQVGANAPASLRQANGDLLFDIPGLPRGQHTIQASAFNTSGESRSSVFQFEVKDQMPAAPGNFRIVLDVSVQAQSGGDPTVTLRLVQVAQQP